MLMVLEKLLDAGIIFGIPITIVGMTITMPHTKSAVEVLARFEDVSSLPSVDGDWGLGNAREFPVTAFPPPGKATRVGLSRARLVTGRCIVVVYFRSERTPGRTLILGWLLHIVVKRL